MRAVYPALFVLMFIFAGNSLTLAQRTATAGKAVPLTSNEKIQLRKSFFLLFVLEQPGAARQAVLKDTLFSRMARVQQERINAAWDQCRDVPCIAQALQWNNEETAAIGNEFAQLAAGNPSIQALVARLKTTGRYPLYTAEPDTVFIRKVWQDVASGINYICKVYLAGEKPRYPKIDSISFYAMAPAFLQLVKGSLGPVVQQRRGTFYAQPLTAALKALTINGRDEAARYEPLYAGANAAPFSKAKHVNWKAYRYSAILVPGAGPGKDGQNMDSTGAYRCKLAAEHYRRGTAPFIIVSGGHVHPFRTPFCEAVEMKKYLTGRLGVPDSAVIIEPHARHTTTNIRNAERLMFLIKMPPSKPALIVTDPMQTMGIDRIEGRMKKELGYVPYKSLDNVGMTETVFLPDLKAWQHDPYDPLDP